MAPAKSAAAAKWYTSYLIITKFIRLVLAGGRVGELGIGLVWIEKKF